MMTIGERIHLIRKRTGESQKELAEYIGTHLTAVSHWERGMQEPHARAIREICKHYKVSADWLLGLEDES